MGKNLGTLPPIIFEADMPSDNFWKSVERTALVAGAFTGIAGLIWAVFTYLRPPNQITDVSDRQNPQAQESKEASLPSPTEPSQSSEPLKKAPMPTEIGDRMTIETSFGRLFDLKGTSKFIAPNSPDHATIRKRIEKLVVSGDDLIYTIWDAEQDATQEWATGAEPAYPLPGSSNPRKVVLQYMCRAPLRELNAAAFAYGEVRLTCAFGECFKCNGTVENTFGAPSEKLVAPHSHIEVHPNEGRGPNVVEAIGRLQTPLTAYRN